MGEPLFSLWTVPFNDCVKVMAEEEAQNSCEGGLFSLMPRSSGWILRAAGSSCTGNTVGMTGARLPSSA